MTNYDEVKKYDASVEDIEMYVFEFGSLVKVSVEYKDGEFIVNNPVKIPRKITYSLSSPFLGGYQEFNNTEDPRYINSLELINS